MTRTATGVTLGLCLAFAPARVVAGTAAIELEVDATDVAHGIQRARLVIPVAPGEVTLAYPKWIPGEHAATGPLTQVVGLEVKAGGKRLAWRRDPLDAFAFHVDVAAGIDALEVQFDYLSPPRAFGDGYGKTPNVTPHLLILPFNQVLLYPRQAATDAVRVKARVHLPSGWKFDCALQPERVAGETVELPEVSLTTLVDSPLLAGQHLRTIRISDAPGATRISMAADDPADLAAADAEAAPLGRLVAEAQALFGARHYREYTWLVALGDRLDQNGLEHHESTDIRGAESFFADPAQRMRWGSVIPHEFVHSWNGKYRRPAGLVTRNYQEPMADDLLWVYEGLTRYLGDLVLRARSGLRTPEQMRDYVAWIAAAMDRDRPGRSWRSLGDTATGLPGYNDAPPEWAPERRGRDFYDEMLLVWLEADTVLRQKSGGARSLDDFCRSFFGGETGAPSVRAYTRDDVVAALHAVAPYDWAAFFAARIDAVSPAAPLEGLTASGWRLAFDDTPNEYLSAR